MEPQLVLKRKGVKVSDASRTLKASEAGEPVLGCFVLGESQDELFLQLQSGKARAYSGGRISYSELFCHQ